MNQATGMPVTGNVEDGSTEDEARDARDEGRAPDVDGGTIPETVHDVADPDPQSYGDSQSDADEPSGADLAATDGPDGPTADGGGRDDAAAQDVEGAQLEGAQLSDARAEVEAGAVDTGRDEATGEQVDAGEGVTDESGAAAPMGGKGRRSRLAILEREGEVAADFLERLLDIADLDGDIDVDIDGDRAAVAIVDSDEGRVPRRLVGPDGRVLEALQELTRLAVQTATGERSRLMLDVAGFRAERRSSLVELARTAIEQVRASGEQQALADMSAFERKVVHDEVTAAGLVSESEGIEPHRHIVIRPS